MKTINEIKKEMELVEIVKSALDVSGKIAQDLIKKWTQEDQCTDKVKTIGGNISSYPVTHHTGEKVLNKEEVKRMMENTAQTGKSIGVALSSVASACINCTNDENKQENQKTSTKEKFKYEQSLNHVTLNILDKYKLKVTPSINIESIVIDVASPKDECTYITLLGSHTYRNTTYVKTLNIEGYNLAELAGLIVTMIKAYHPSNVEIDPCGGRGLIDELNVEFKKENIHYSDNGLIVYGYKEKEVKVTDKRKEEIEKIIKVAENELKRYQVICNVTNAMFGNNSASKGLLKMIKLNKEVIKRYKKELYE